MDIISYRGPGKSGGVSSGLARLWNKGSDEDGLWHFLDETSVKCLKSGTGDCLSLGTIDAEVVSGHYRYSNEFIWPVMHGLSQYARYDATDHRQYIQFNVQLAELLRGTDTAYGGSFVQDYQLALLPELLHQHNVKIFWHIPWPATVEKSHLHPVIEMATGLLNSKLIGFQIAEYAVNFLRLVENDMSDYQVDWESLSVLKTTKTATSADQIHTTKVVSTPMGIDTDYWNQLALANSQEVPAEILALFAGGDVVLSVDRADITKGVPERFSMINRFFELHPEQCGKVTFLQVLNRTRSGVGIYDELWNNCHSLASSINSRYSKADWKPMHWIEHPLTEVQLSALYRRATVMLVNPIRDGLNVTAKEYVICQNIQHPGVLLLSTGAGVWTELGGYALQVDPTDPDQMCSALMSALTMEPGERMSRLGLMKKQVEAWTLSHWWELFAEAVQQAA